MENMKFLTILFVIQLSAFSIEMQAGSGDEKEYKFKAAYLLNFLQFVEWPEDVNESINSPIVIGILGEDPFHSLIDQAVEGETIKGRKVLIQRFRSLDEVERCHLLFVGKSEKSKTPYYLSHLLGQKILTVGESDGFAAQGGVINFFQENTKLRFEINEEAAKNAGLKISSKLLRLAKIVSTQNSGKE